MSDTSNTPKVQETRCMRKSAMEPYSYFDPIRHGLGEAFDFLGKLIDSDALPDMLAGDAESTRESLGVALAILRAREEQEEARIRIQEDIDAGKDSGESQTRLAHAKGREKDLLDGGALSLQVRYL